MKRPLALVTAVVAALIAQASAAPRGAVVRVEHRDPETLPTRGPVDAPVTVELFFMPASRLGLTTPMYRGLERLQSAHPTRVRVIYRVIKRDSNLRIAIAALEAHAQGKFFELMEQLHLQRTASSLTQEQLIELARKVGMDTGRLEAAITEKRYSEAFAETDQRLTRFAGNSVPSVLFNSRLARISMNPPNDRELDAELRLAYDRAQDLLDAGVSPRDLVAASDDQERKSEAPYLLRPPEGDETEPTEPPLATPALDLTGLPSFGPTEEPPGGTLPVVLVCRPNDSSCTDAMRNLRALQQSYSKEIRIVWAPWFDVEEADDADELTMVADAILCAEKVGSSAKEMSASAGWAWTVHLYEVLRRRSLASNADDLIDQVGKDLGIDSPQMSACRAQHAGQALTWIGAARRSGITRTPTLVIGGRIYDYGATNGNAIQQLVEVELAPGLLGEAAPDYRNAR